MYLINDIVSAGEREREEGAGFFRLSRSPHQCPQIRADTVALICMLNQNK